MRYVLCLLALFAAGSGFGQQRFILYDTKVLRIPGASLPFGMVTIADNGDTLKTYGFLHGRDGWGKYKFEVQGGRYSAGYIDIRGTDDYKKSDSITVNVYTRKWFLGGKDKWLLTQKIPYNYDTAINILTTGNFSRAPGDHVQFGIRTWYDNKMSVDKWFPAKNNLKDFDFDFDGGHISKSKGDLKIETDPVKISHDKVRLVAVLARHPVIRDTLQIVLDYVAKYQCSIQSGGVGDNLHVAADVFFDSLIGARLLRVDVFDSTSKKNYHYLVNTKGGSITISSSGGSGSGGRDGSDGLSGLNGSGGTFNTDVQTTVGPDGKVETTTTTVQGAGGDGQRGADGGNGEDGGSGGDGGNITVSYTPAAKPFLTMIKALSVPGAGGTGGRAGRGGTGGMGGSGNPSGMQGLNGLDGRAGWDGHNGSKGNVIFVAQ